MTDKQINELLEENNICVHCGGQTREVIETDEDHDEIYSLTVCDDCGFEE